jgi:hypothetical protein
MGDVAHILKGAFSGLEADEALGQPADSLLRFSSAAQTAFETIDIHTVFDLASSRVFATANALLTIQHDPSTAEARLYMVATDAVQPPAAVPVAKVRRSISPSFGGLRHG